MANPKPTATNQPIRLSPEVRDALNVLLAFTSNVPAERTATPAKHSATDEFAANRGRTAPRNVIEIRPGTDPTLDPRFLGERPIKLCSFCHDPWDQHWDNDNGEFIPADEWHRRDYIGGDGYYADEIPAVTR